MANGMRFVVIHLALILLAGCAGAMSQADLFPRRNADSTIGLIINEGETALNVWIYDQYDRPIREMYVPPAEQLITYNGRNRVVITLMSLPQGNYRVEYVPFYHVVKALGLVRYRVDGPRGSAGIVVTDDPYRFYYEGRHYGWILRLNGGRAPLPAPIPRLHFTCNWPISCQ